MKAIVTGANGGMGKEICKALLDKGMNVVMMCRPRTVPCEFYCDMLKKYGESRVSILGIDLASEESIKTAAMQVVNAGEHVDILVNNAGMMGWEPQVAENGLEMHNMVNCFGPALFTWLLRPVMHDGTRVVDTVSVTIWLGKIRSYFPYPPLKGFNRIKRYSDSKLAFQLLSLRLAEEWRSDGIAVNTSDPGIVDTPIIKLHSWVDPLTDIFYRPFIRKPRRGAATAIFLALDDSVAGNTGGLYRNERQKDLKRIANHPDIPKVWDMFRNMVNDC